MAAREKTKQAAGPAAVLLAADAKRKSIPVWLARNAGWLREAPLTSAQKAWVEAQGFKGGARKHLLLPGPEGTLAGAVLGLGEARAGDPMDKPELAVGHLPGVLPSGCYHLADDLGEPELAAVAWGLGAYRFRRYKSGEAERGGTTQGAARRRSRPRALRRRRGLARSRPHQHAGQRPGAAGAGGCRPPARQEARCQRVEHRRRRSAGQEFPDDPRRRPGQRPAPAADRPQVGRPGGRAGAAMVTLVGKGICFDTGGLDIKPASGMLHHEEGHGRGGRGAGARAHGDGGQARPAPAHPDPGRRQQHCRQRLPPRRCADQQGRPYRRDRQHRRRGPAGARRCARPCRRGAARVRSPASPP